jgi:hypothetical protein
LITPAFCQRRRPGRRDATVDLVWPAREGAEYWLQPDGRPRACLLVLARDGDSVIGQLVGS